ncbi:MAG: hypothetical protein KatS3mg102_1315 [Planctomycetota bacterium]|nr:MAG: hypothetical protein KatS3mg102_1315 [Planctomycetota bacterium]
MTPGGWLIMSLSVGFVVGLLAWCVYKVLTTPGSEQHLRDMREFEAPDLEASGQANGGASAAG